MTDWTKITPDQFEELCWHLLESEGYVNIRRLGGSGDRGRDVIADRHSTIMRGKTRTERWILQAKRYTSAPPRPRDFEDTMAWTRAHEPFGLLFAFPHTLSPDSHDWLETTAKNRGIAIETIDIDYLESFLARSPIARARFFGEESKNTAADHASSIGRFINAAAQVATLSPTSVYTAGKMASEAQRGALAKWRSDLEAEVQSRGSPVGFLHPELIGCDHTGIALAETVEADALMLRRARIVVGYLDDADMPATLVELMIALEAGKNVGLFVNHRLVHEFDSDIYGDLYKTKHGCDCMLYQNGPDFIARTPYWFFLTYVRQAYPDVMIQLVDDSDAMARIADFIEFHADALSSIESRPLSGWF